MTVMCSNCAEYQLYVSHWAKDMHVLVRTNVKSTAASSTWQGSMQR